MPVWNACRVVLRSQQQLRGINTLPQLVNGANHSALSPLGWIKRAAQAWPDSAAVVHNDLERSWAATYDRTVCLLERSSPRGGRWRLLLVPSCGHRLHAAKGQQECPPRLSSHL